MEQVATIVPVNRIELVADVSLPDGAEGLVLFAHGSGSSRLSPRNRHVADVLNRGTIGTILIDLLRRRKKPLTSKRLSYASTSRYSAAVSPRLPIGSAGSLA